METEVSLFENEERNLIMKKVSLLMTGVTLALLSGTDHAVSIGSDSCPEAQYIALADVNYMIEHGHYTGVGGVKWNFDGNTGSYNIGKGAHYDPEDKNFRVKSYNTAKPPCTYDVVFDDGDIDKVSYTVGRFTLTPELTSSMPTAPAKK